MSTDEINRIINDYIKNTARLLPDGFETEDLLEDLRIHIHESLSDKIRERPRDDPKHLIREVLDNLGSPEEIAIQYSHEQIQEPNSKDPTSKWTKYIMRITATVLVVVLTSWLASIVTEGVVNFNVAVITLLFFAVLEWFVRTKQTKDA